MAKKKYTEEEIKVRKNLHQKEYAKRTNYSANHKYNHKTYTRISFDLRNEIAEKYKAKCRECNIPYSKVLHDAINKFIEDNLPSE